VLGIESRARPAASRRRDAQIALYRQ